MAAHRRRRARRDHRCSSSSSARCCRAITSRRVTARIAGDAGLPSGRRSPTSPTIRHGAPTCSASSCLPPTDGKTTWREHSSNGAILMVADRAEPPTRLVTRIADDKLPFGGTWDYVDRAERRRGERRHDHRARLSLQSGLSLRVALHPRPHGDDGHLPSLARPQVRRRRHADGRRSRSLNFRLISEAAMGYETKCSVRVDDGSGTIRQADAARCCSRPTI